MAKNPLGFHNPNPEEIRQEESTVDELMRNISKETRTTQEFESRLIKELRDVRDMENNLKNIHLQLESMQKLLKVRGEIFRKLLDEQMKGSQMNIGECRKYFDSINQINQELGASVNISRTELSRLIIEEASIKSMESENTREVIRNIDERARALNNEIQLIAANQSSIDNTSG